MLSLWHACPATRRRRKSSIAGSILVIFLIVATVYNHKLSWPRTSSPRGFSRGPDSILKQQAEFWRSIYHIVLFNDPRTEKLPEVVVPAQLDIAFQDDHVHERPDIMWMDEPDVSRMRNAHSNYVNDIRSANLKLVYDEGSQGIITTVSDSQLPVLLISIRMTRKTGSVLPIEVFLWQPTPYTDHVCSNILPALNASCTYLSKILVEASTDFGIKSYQHKIFAVIFSPFDKLLFLDADAWPATNPDDLFESPPFLDTGLILWPDFWYASESPYFFDIAKIDNPPALADRASTEAGALLYHKARHGPSIMLAIYYNFYGPEYYYPLQSQGAPGQGDKETFGLAAMALGETYYSVKTKVTALGRSDSGGKWLGSAMVQYDPTIDYVSQEIRHISGVHPVYTHPEELASLPSKQDAHHEHAVSSPSPPPPPPPKAPTEHFPNHPSYASTASSFHPKPLFIHANYPKFDPRFIFDDEPLPGSHTPTRDTNGTSVRCWEMTPQESQSRFGFDLEERFWSVILEVACEDLIGKGSQNDERKGEKERRVCSNVKEYIDKIFPDLTPH